MQNKSNYVCKTKNVCKTNKNVCRTNKNKFAKINMCEKIINKIY